MHSLLTKYASAWDKLEEKYKSLGGRIVYTDEEEDGLHGPTFYAGGDFDLKTDKGPRHFKGGDIAYGFKERRPGVLAHEMGHADVWSKASDPYKWLVDRSLEATNRPLLNSFSTLLPAAGLVGSLITKNPYWLLGGSGLGLVAAAPSLINELRANRAGKKLLDEAGGSEKDRDDVSGGFMSHVIHDAAIPTAGLLGAAVLAYLNRDKK